MAVEIIDLTSPSPPPIPVKLTDKETKKRRKPRRTRREVREREAQGRWQHDRYLDEDVYIRGKKRKMDEDEDKDEGHSNRRKNFDRSISPFFAVDTVPDKAAVDTFIPAPLADDIVDIDLQSVGVPNPVQAGLLLPAHVTLVAGNTGSTPDDNPPLSPVSAASGIDFVDDDRVVGAPRYFDDKPITSKMREPCKRCGDHGHHFKSCSAMICLTCGARDEHSSRSCPILRFCWNCKGKGHIAKNCPRIGGMDSHRLDRDDCERCGSRRHHGTNCPTIWRIYTYLTDTERDAVLADRESKRELGFDKGGEGYIARDPWCYNCGHSGHLGDDCEMASNHDKPNDYSAFGSYNQLTGPFASSSAVIPDTKRPPREWEADARFDDGDDFSPQTHVGRKGRENAKAKAREAQRLLDEADDEPDWFDMNQAASKNRKMPPSNPKNRANLPSKPAPPTIHLGFRKSSSSQAPWDPSAASYVQPMSSRRSLLDRIDDEGSLDKSRVSGGGDNPATKGSRRNGEQRRPTAARGSNEQKRRDDRGKDREKHSSGSRRDRHGQHGSRWRGGYDR